MYLFFNLHSEKSHFLWWRTVLFRQVHWIMYFLLQIRSKSFVKHADPLVVPLCSETDPTPPSGHPRGRDHIGDGQRVGSFSEYVNGIIPYVALGSFSHLVKCIWSSTMLAHFLLLLSALLWFGVYHSLFTHWPVEAHLGYFQPGVLGVHLFWLGLVNSGPF